MSLLKDIRTPRLILRLMTDEAMAACLAGELERAERLIGVTIPIAVLDRPTSLRYGLARWAEDPDYQPWSMRAIILPQSRTMVGHTRFHSCPDPDYLHRYARGAVELGYCIFTEYQRQGYATEAVKAVMDWAQSVFGVCHFVASVSPDNQASLRLIARFGFAEVGTELDEIDGMEHVFLRTATAA